MMRPRNMKKRKENALSVTELLLTTEVAEILIIHPETIRRALRDRRLEGIKVGRGWRIDRSEVTRVRGQGGL